MNKYKTRPSISAILIIFLLLVTQLITANFNQLSVSRVFADDVSSNCDINADGSVNAADLISLKKVFLQSSDEEWNSYDVNNDGSVNTLDLVVMIRNILTPSKPDTPVVIEYRKYTFRNSTLLNNHYQKHGIEMGFGSAEEYEKAASDVANSPEALHKKEKEDNDDVYYIEATNEFVVISTDGYIRTYFKPDKGKAYFDRQ